MRKTKKIDAFLVKDTFEPLYTGQINMDINDLNDPDTVYSVSRENDVEGVMQMARNQHINAGKIRAKVLSAEVNTQNVPASRFPTTKTVTMNGKKYCFAKAHIVDHGLHGCYLDPCAPNITDTEAAIRFDLLPWIHSQGPAVQAPKAASLIELGFEHGPASGHQRNPHYTTVVDDGNVAMAHRDCDPKTLRENPEIRTLEKYSDPNRISRGAELSGELCSKMGVDSILKSPGTVGTVEGPLMAADEATLSPGQKMIRKKVKEYKTKGWIDDEAAFVESLLAASMAMAEQESSWSSTNPGDGGTYSSTRPGLEVNVKPYAGAKAKKGKYCSFGYWQFNICGDTSGGTQLLEYYGFHTPVKSKGANNPTDDEKQDVRYKNKKNSKMSGYKWHQYRLAGLDAQQAQAWENSILDTLTSKEKNVDYFINGQLAKERFWQQLEKIFKHKGKSDIPLNPTAPIPGHAEKCRERGQPKGWAVDHANPHKITDKDLGSWMINAFEQPCAGHRPGRENYTPRMMANIKALGLAGCKDSVLDAYQNASQSYAKDGRGRPCISKKRWNDTNATVSDRQAEAAKAIQMSRGKAVNWCPTDSDPNPGNADIWTTDDKGVVTISDPPT